MLLPLQFSLPQSPGQIVSRFDCLYTVCKDIWVYIISQLLDLIPILAFSKVTVVHLDIYVVMFRQINVHESP